MPMPYSSPGDLLLEVKYPRPMGVISSSLSSNAVRRRNSSRIKRAGTSLRRHEDLRTDAAPWFEAVVEVFEFVVVVSSDVTGSADANLRLLEFVLSISQRQHWERVKRQHGVSVGCRSKQHGPGLPM
jgi:hypothetical protein